MERTVTPAEFTRQADAHGLTGKAREGVRLVEVDGLTQYQAAQQLGIAESTISRARRRLARPLCPHCHQPMRAD